MGTSDNRRSVRFGGGGVLRSRPLVTGDSVAIPSCPAAARLECGRIAIERGGRGITGDLGPCRPVATPAEPPRGSVTVKIVQGKGIRRETDGEPEPGNGRRDRTGERRTKGNQRKADDGEEPGGQTGNRRKARRGNRRTCAEAPDHPVRVGGFGAARICDAAGSVLAGNGRLSVARPRRCTPRESAGLRPLRSADRRLRLTRQSSLLAYPVVRRGSRLACGSRRWPPRSGSPACPRGRRRTW
jgi:hypothetical protein